jgi:hypothetical protein
LSSTASTYENAYATKQGFDWASVTYVAGCSGLKLLMPAAWHVLCAASIPALTKLYGILKCLQEVCVSELDDQQASRLFHGPDPLVGQALRVYTQRPPTTCT